MEIEEFSEAVDRLKQAIARVLVGQEAVVEEVLICLLAGGHALLEGVPGLGKTLLVRTLSQSMDLRFARIQFTPDLMPSDIVGTNVIMEDEKGRKRFELAKGPIFAQLVLADEINRATPKTQSALLEAMAERTVTIAGDQHQLEEPFFVMATENPIEMEGTYPLPEAQLDRFLLKILIPQPDEDVLVRIFERTTGSRRDEAESVMDGRTVLSLREHVRTVEIASPLTRYVARLIKASDPQATEAVESARKLLRYGAGVRGGQALILAAKVRALLVGRNHVDFADLRRVALPALRHRVIPNFEAEADGISPDAIIEKILTEVPEVPETVTAIEG